MCDIFFTEKGKNYKPMQTLLIKHICYITIVFHDISPFVTENEFDVTEDRKTDAIFEISDPKLVKNKSQIKSKSPEKKFHFVGQCYKLLNYKGIGLR